MNDKERYYASVAANTIHDITRSRNTIVFQFKKLLKKDLVFLKNGQWKIS